MIRKKQLDCICFSALWIQTLSAPKVFKVEVLQQLNHDIQAFTQGLVAGRDADGFARFYESTGLFGRSSVRIADRASGDIKRIVDLSPQDFGEGLAQVGDELHQLILSSNRALIYDRFTLELLRTEQTQLETGFGAATRGNQLVFSDGTNLLAFYDPKTYEEIQRVKVFDDGFPVNGLNELESIHGEIWANLFPTDCIAIIEPSSGVLTGLVLVSDLVQQLRRDNVIDVFNPDVVLNGIAFDYQLNEIYITGKLWPFVFVIQQVESFEPGILNLARETCLSGFVAPESPSPTPSPSPSIQPSPTLSPSPTSLFFPLPLPISSPVFTDSLFLSPLPQFQGFPLSIFTSLVPKSSAQVQDSSPIFLFNNFDLSFEATSSSEDELIQQQQTNEIYIPTQAYGIILDNLEEFTLFSERDFFTEVEGCQK